MTERINRAFKVSLITHAAIVLLLLVLPLLNRCSKPEKPIVGVTFVSYGQPGLPAGGSPAATPEPQQAAPEPPQPEPPRPEPVIPEPKPTPDPIKIPVKEPEPKVVKQEVKKREIQVNTNKIVRKDLPKTETQPAKPKMSEAELKKLLSSGLPTTPGISSSSSSYGGGGSGGGGGTTSERGLYYGTIQQILFRAWDRPPGVAGLKTTVSLRITKNGAITSSSLIGRSGSQAMDDSVMNAVRAISTLPKFPPSIRESYIDVTIDFESTGLSM